MNLGRVVDRGEASHLDLALLEERVQRYPGLRRRGETGAAQAGEDLARGNVGPDIGLEHFGAHALRAHELPVACHVQLAVGSAQGGNHFVALQLAHQALVAGDQLGLGGGGGQHAIAHQALQRRIAGGRRIQQLGIQRGHLLAQALHFLLVRGVPLALENLAPVDLGHRFALFLEAVVTLQPEQHE